MERELPRVKIAVSTEASDRSEGDQTLQFKMEQEFVKGDNAIRQETKDREQAEKTIIEMVQDLTRTV